MIRFPKMHIANSVQNRILNMARSSNYLGAALDKAIMTPMTPVAPPVDTQDAMLISQMEGGSAVDAAVTETLLND